MKKLLLFLFTTVLSLNAMAQGDYSIVTNILPPSGKQYINNTNITWEVDRDWTLTISGEGEMPNYTTASAPWHNATCTQETKIYLSGNCLYTNTVEVTQKLQIKKIIIDTGITHIGNYAFFSLDDLTSIELPSTLTSIGANAFNGCNNLTTLTGNCNWSELSLDAATSFSGTKVIRNNGALYIGEKLICVYEAYGATELEIEDKTTEICANAFNGNTKVTSITVPSTIRKIGDNAFAGCSSLLDFTLNANNVTFGSNVFDGCSSLPSDETDTYRMAGNNIIVEVVDTDNENYVIPSEIIYIADNAFVNCTNVKTIKCTSTPAMATNALSNENGPHLYVEDGNEDKFKGKGITIDKINYTKINLHSSGYSTIALDHSAIIPEGVEAYTVTSDGTKINYKRVKGNKLAKGTGYFIVGTGNVTFEPAKESIAEGNGNNLVGVTEKTRVSGSDIYFLSTTQGGVTGFFCLGTNEYEFPANKAYLQVSGTIGNAQYFLVHLDETETRIDNTESEEKTSHSRNNVYNLAGQKMSHPQKGINIVNGKLTIM